MDLSKTKLYRAIKDPKTSIRELWEVSNDFVNSKKNINIKDSLTGENFLHVLASHGGQLTSSCGVTVIYLMASSGIDLDTRDRLGDTCLHKAVRVKGSYRIVEALMRYIFLFSPSFSDTKSHVAVNGPFEKYMEVWINPGMGANFLMSRGNFVNM